MSSQTRPSEINPYESARETADQTGQPSREPVGPPPSRGSLLVIFLTVFIDLLGFGMVLPLLPIYAKSFSVDVGGWEIAFLMSSFSAMQFVFAPLWGRRSDRVGRRPVLLTGAAAFALAIFCLPESLRPGEPHAEHPILDPRAWANALAMPSVPALLAASFVSVLSFGAFETTLSLLLTRADLPFRFEFHEVLLF